MAKKDKFDTFFEKQFGPEGVRGVEIAKPLGGDRSTSFEERRRQGAGEGGAEAADAAGPSVGATESVPVAVEEEPRRPGRPKTVRKEVCPMNFLIEKDLKTRLELLKIDLYRSSVTDLVKEALHDLLVKYGRE